MNNPENGNKTQGPEPLKLKAAPGARGPNDRLRAPEGQDESGLPRRMTPALQAHLEKWRTGEMSATFDATLLPDFHLMPAFAETEGAMWEFKWFPRRLLAVCDGSDICQGFMAVRRGEGYFGVPFDEMIIKSDFHTDGLVVRGNDTLEDGTVAPAEFLAVRPIEITLEVQRRILMRDSDLHDLNSAKNEVGNVVRSIHTAGGTKQWVREATLSIGGKGGRMQ